MSWAATRPGISNLMRRHRSRGMDCGQSLRCDNVASCKGFGLQLGRGFQPDAATLQPRANQHPKLGYSHGRQQPAEGALRPLRRPLRLVGVPAASPFWRDPSGLPKGRFAQRAPRGRTAGPAPWNLQPAVPKARRSAGSSGPQAPPRRTCGRRFAQDAPRPFGDTPQRTAL